MTVLTPYRGRSRYQSIARRQVDNRDRRVDACDLDVISLAIATSANHRARHC
jgi:hypothetical protein